MREHGVHPAYATLAGLIEESGYRNRMPAFRVEKKMGANSVTFKTVIKDSRQAANRSEAVIG